MNLRIGVSFALMALVFGTGLGQSPDAPTLAITHVSIVDPALDGVREDMTVLVKDGKIQRISAAKVAKIPPGAEIVDGRKDT